MARKSMKAEEVNIAHEQSKAVESAPQTEVVKQAPAPEGFLSKVIHAVGLDNSTQPQGAPQAEIETNQTQSQLGSVRGKDLKHL